MAEDKKIIIKKNGGFKPAPNKLQKNLDLLEQTVKRIENKYKVFGFYDSKEEEFFKNNQGKDVVIELQNGVKVEGKLEGIDKFRISLQEKGIRKYFFKHAILCYFAK